jgi:hypothetical protein
VAELSSTSPALETRKTTKRSKRPNILGPHIPYGLLETKGEVCAKVGSHRFRNVDLYKVHTQTNTLTFRFIYKIHTYKLIHWERGCTSCVENYLICLNIVNWKEAIG